VCQNPARQIAQVIRKGVLEYGYVQTNMVRERRYKVTLNIRQKFTASWGANLEMLSNMRTVMGGLRLGDETNSLIHLKVTTKIRGELFAYGFCPSAAAIPEAIKEPKSSSSPNAD
jgi:hypothetical protein